MGGCYTNSFLLYITSIMNFLEREYLLSAYQFGFRSGLSAADLLTALN